MQRRVVQWATGTVGVHAAPAIARHPDLDLVGVWVHSPDKVGRDAGEVCGVEPLGVRTTDDRDALLALEPDCISYMAASDVRPDGVIDDLCDFLARGIDVANISYVPLLNPAVAGEGVLERLEAACRAGGASLYTTGIDPGFANAGLAIQALALCEQVRQVRMMEIVNYATWNQAFTLFEIMAFAKREPTEGLLLSPGSTALAWGPVLELVARAMGVGLDRIEEWHEVRHAVEAVEIDAGTIPAGGISAMHFEVRGFVGDQQAIVLEHVTRMRDEDAPEWPQWPNGNGYRVLIDGEPSVRLDLQLSSGRGDHNVANCLGAAMHVVNAIPTLCDADSGVYTYLDLPVYAARPPGLVR